MVRSVTRPVIRLAIGASSIAALCSLIVGLGAAFAAAPPIDIRSTDWAGVEVFKGKLQSLGGIVDVGSASLAVDAAGDFVYTDPDGNGFSGHVTQVGKKLTVTYDAAAIDALEATLADLIVSEAAGEGIDVGTVTVDIDPASIRLTAKLRSSAKKGDSVTFSTSMKFTAVSSIYGARKGGFKTKGALALVD
jgi:hypothetical protein